MQTEIPEPRLLAKLARDRVLVGLAVFHAPAGTRPDRLVRKVEADEKDSANRVAHERANAGAKRLPARTGGELLEPAQPLRVGHGCVRRRCRREDKELRLFEPPLVDAELRPLVEGAPDRRGLM